MSCTSATWFLFFFLVAGEFEEGGNIVGRMMIGDDVISAVCGLRLCLMVELVNGCSIWTAGGEVSSGVGCRRAGVDLVFVVISLLAVVGLQDHSPAESAGCLLFRPSSWRILQLVLMKASSTQTRSFPLDNLQIGAPTKLNSFSAFINTDGIMVIR